MVALDAPDLHEGDLLYKLVGKEDFYMALVVVIAIILVVLIGLRIILNIDMDTVKAMAKNEKLDKITNAFPENLEICKKICAMIGNNSVKIEEDKQSKTSLYLVVGNKISIANLKNSFTRIQTIAHECIHSMQDKRILWSNFIFSNVFLVYLVVAIVLTVMGVFKDAMLQVNILCLMGFVCYFVRSYLENDAMIKARYLAREYMKYEKILKPQEMQEILENYDILNKIGVKAVNYKLIFSALMKVLVYAIVAYIVTLYIV